MRRGDAHAARGTASDLVDRQTGHFFVGGKYVDTKDGPVLAGQAYVEYYIPTNRTHPYPIWIDRRVLPRGRRIHGHA